VEEQTKPANGSGSSVSRGGFDPSRWRGVLPWSVVLVLLVGWAYLPVLRYGFVDYDDSVYMTANRQLSEGLTRDNVGWAFTTTQAGFWHPLTWLSYMLDCQIFGMRPGGLHLTNLVLHVANTVLLFVVLRLMTGALRRSAFVAALFALHPLHVESVAWIAERKDVLSTLFWMLSLLMYARYAEEFKAHPPSAPGATGSPRTKVFYAATFFFFVCGLMSKAMVVTLPLVLLLLDWWPLRRFELSTRNGSYSEFKRIFLEKLPFVAASVACAVITVHAEKGFEALPSSDDLPFVKRAANAMLSYACYLLQTFWPADLAVAYPFPKPVPVWSVGCAALLILALSAGALWMARQKPYLAVGWIWYLATLLPVIGLIQVGYHARADRYTYIPLIGIFILLSWGAHELTRHWRYQMAALCATATAIVLLCSVVTRQQVGYWKDGKTLFQHAIAAVENNYLAHFYLGIVLSKEGRVDEAIHEYQEALRLRPNVDVYNGFGVFLEKNDRLDGAIEQFQEAVRLDPDFAEAHYNLGMALDRKGCLDNAIAEYQQAVRLEPDNADAHKDLGIALNRKGQPDEALVQFQEALRLQARSADIRYNLGNALLRKGRPDEAIVQFQEALKLKPDMADGHNNLGVVLSQKGRLDEAISHFQEALKIKPDYVEAQKNLATALSFKHRPPGPKVDPRQP
jgi:tetratricopeptide (TPR) repeat protein